MKIYIFFEVFFFFFFFFFTNVKHLKKKSEKHTFFMDVKGFINFSWRRPIKLFAEIARSQASSRQPAGHISRRLIDISQIAVQIERYELYQLSKTAEGCVSLFTTTHRRPFQQPESLPHLMAMNAVGK